MQLAEAGILELALGAVDEAIGIYDARGRLMAFNQRYAVLRSAIGGTVELGSKWLDLVVASVAAGSIPEAVGREAEWLRYRRSVRGDYSIIRRLPDCQYYKVNEQRAQSGSSAVIWHNVTPLIEPGRNDPRPLAPLQARVAGNAEPGTASTALFQSWRRKGLSVRASTLLSLAGCRSAVEVRKLGHDYFRAQPNCGPVTLAEISRLAQRR